MFASVFEPSYTISQRFARCGFRSGWNFCADAIGSGGVLLRVTKTKMPHPQRRFITALHHASKPFQCVCRDRRHFGSRTEMNVSCGRRLRADTLTQIRPRSGIRLGRICGIVASPCCSTVVGHDQSAKQPIWCRDPSVVSRQFLKKECECLSAG